MSKNVYYLVYADHNTRLLLSYVCYSASAMHILHDELKRRGVPAWFQSRKDTPYTRHKLNGYTVLRLDDSYRGTFPWPTRPRGRNKQKHISIWG